MPTATRETYIAARSRAVRRSASPRVIRRRRIAVTSVLLSALVIAAVAASGLIAAAVSGQLKVPQGLPGAPAAVSVDDGYISDADPVSPFATDHPAVTNLDPAVRDAIQAAARDAEADGITIELTSGWRSSRYQDQLLSDAILEYGSAEAASEFVSTPEKSLHVTGMAVDVWGVDPGLWLNEHGTAYGLCQIYANERWHFEIATEPGGVCPPMLANASESA